MIAAELQPIVVYGSELSYFTGKLETYFRLRGIDYELRGLQFPGDERRFKQLLGLSQMPVVGLGDGRWMTDTTSIIQWFEARYVEQPVVPSDPVLHYACLLIEDYADEWLWRPAMHYRWHYEGGALLQSRHLASEIAGTTVAPSGLKRWMIRRRQRRCYTTGDGITRDNVDGVEGIYLRLLAQLQVIFSTRPFLLGDRPSLADVGLSGPFFRHFGLDPIPLEIMRRRAPAVLEWVARLWNTRLEQCSGDWLRAMPEDLMPILRDIGRVYLPYLHHNAEAVAAGRKRFDVEVGGVAYRGARYSRYRVFCLQQLRTKFMETPETERPRVEQLLHECGAWDPLWQLESLPLEPGQDQELPFRASTKMVGVNE